jgi:hypothetical protein
MRIGMAIIAILATVSAADAIAQPDKSQQPTKAPKLASTAPVILASASDARRPSPANADRPSESTRRPAPRITTCRCGDPQPGDSQPDE